jgi:DNA-binding transcriptional LysR family regulator
VPKAPEDLATHNCLNFSLRTRAIVWSFESHAIDACPATGNASTNQAPMLRELGLRGVGIIRVADFVASEDIRTGALVQLLPDFTHEPRQPIFAVYQRQPEQSLRIRTFVDFLHQKFSNSPWRMPRP